MEYSKKEFEAIVLAGILWEEIVDRELVCKEDSSMFRNHKVDLNSEAYFCPLCGVFNSVGYDLDCEDCPLLIIGECCRLKSNSVFNRWAKFPTKKNAQAVLEGIYKGSDGCTIRK